VEAINYKDMYQKALQNLKIKDKKQNIQEKIEKDVLR